MQLSRTERLDKTKRVRKRTYAALVVTLLVTVGLAGAWIISARATNATDAASSRSIATPRSTGGATTLDAPATAQMTSAEDASGTPEFIEVPSVVGEPLAEAEFVLGAVGLMVERSGVASANSTSPVTAQEPGAGTKVRRGSLVTLTAGSPVTAKKKAAPIRQRVVVIDPGHQARGDSRPEPLGPGSKETKERATVGVVGIATRVPEYRVTLEISRRLARKLRDAGVKVVYTRTTSDVDLSNAERAAIANRARADLFVRVHADAGAVPTDRGVATTHPARNEWTGRIESRSVRAARLVQTAVLEATRARNRGIAPRGDMAGFNWSKVPVIAVETGLLTNAEDDRLLVTPGYQDKVAEGMAEGILAYLGMGKAR